MRISEKCHNKNSNIISSNILTSRHIDGDKTTKCIRRTVNLVGNL